MDDLLRIAHQPHSALPLDVLAGLTLLSVAPFVLVLSTSFVPIVVTTLAELARLGENGFGVCGLFRYCPAAEGRHPAQAAA